MLGAGAVGCYYGAVLARAGRDVTLIARPTHVEAIARDGVRVLQGEREWRVPIGATTGVEAARDADLVLVTVKTPDTTAAVRTLVPWLRPETRLLSLQNGVDNAQRIAVAAAQPTYAAVVYVGAYMDGAGTVRHTGGGDLVLGAPRLAREPAVAVDARRDLEAIVAMFGEAGIQCTIADEIDAALWTKLTINCAFNAVSGLGNSRYGRMAASPDVRAVMEEAVRETVAVGRAAGVPLDADGLIARVWQVAAMLDQQYSSTAQDLQRGKATEIDALNGFVAQRGAELGIATPVNRALHALVKLRESA